MANEKSGSGSGFATSFFFFLIADGPTYISTTYASGSYGTYGCQHITITTGQNIYSSTFVLHNSQGDAPKLGQPFCCEHSHCRETPFEAGPVVSFFVVLVSAQLVGRRSSPFNILEKNQFRRLHDSGKNPEILACLGTTRLRTRDLHVVAHVGVRVESGSLPTEVSTSEMLGIPSTAIVDDRTEIDLTKKSRVFYDPLTFLPF